MRKHKEFCFNSWRDEGCRGEYDGHGIYEGREMENIGEISGTRIYQCPNCKEIKLWVIKGSKVNPKE